MTFTLELQMLAYSALLGLAHLALLTALGVSQRGFAWGIGPRDAEAPPLPVHVARLERAYHNFRETFPLFAAGIMIANAIGQHAPMVMLGAQLYFWARLAYVPAYVLAVPFTRTLCWAVAMTGIGLVLAGLVIR